MHLSREIYIFLQKNGCTFPYSRQAEKLTTIVIIRENTDYNYCHNYPYPYVGTPVSRIVATMVTAGVTTAIGVIEHLYAPLASAIIMTAVIVTAVVL